MKKAIGITLILVFLISIAVLISGCSSPTATPTATPVANVTVTPVANVTATPLPATAPNFTTLTPGVLSMPVDTTFPPMESLNTSLSGQDQFVGFDMDLMRAMCKYLNITPKFTTVPWTTALSVVQTGQYDCSISSWSITGERQKTVTFTDPYYSVQQTMVVRKDDGSIKNWTDIVDKNKVVACQMTTTGANVSENLVGSNGQKINIANVKEFDSSEQSYDELKAGRADVVINDIEINGYEVQLYPGDFKFTGDKWPVLEPYAIIVNKNNPDLTAALNWALAQVKKDGTYDMLLEKYNLA